MIANNLQAENYTIDAIEQQHQQLCPIMVGDLGQAYEELPGRSLTTHSIYYY